MLKTTLFGLFLFLLPFSAHAATADWALAHAPRQTMVRVPFGFFDNRILIHAQINGRGPYTLIFDTGGSNILTPEVAHELGLSLTPSDPVSGAGSVPVPTWTTQVDQILLGDLQGIHQEFLVLDLSSIKTAFNFEQLDGIVGYEILQKFVTRVDYQGRTLTFKIPSAPMLTERGAVILPIEIQGEHPVIAGSVNGFSGKIMIDTGDRSAFTLCQKFSLKTGLKNLFSGSPEVLSGYGVGGPIPAHLGTMETISFGGKAELPKVLARLPDVRGGVYAKSDWAGTVGNEILRRFTVTFDYPHKLMSLQPNRTLSEPYRFTPVPNPPTNRY